MEKYLASLISFIVILSLFGCGSSSENNSAQKTDDIALMSYAQTVIKGFLYEYMNAHYYYIGNLINE